MGDRDGTLLDTILKRPHCFLVAMTDFHDSRYFKFNKLALSCVGLWPYQRKISKYCTLAIGLCGLSSLCIPQIAYIYEVINDVDSVFECLPTTGGALICAIKAVSFICMPEKVERLLQRVREDWNLLRFDSEVEILRNYAERGRRLTIGYTLFAVGPLLFFISLPVGSRILDILAPLNESRSNLLPYPGEFFVDQEKHFDTILLAEYVACCVCLIVAVGVDTIYISFIEHVCGMFAVVSHRLENMEKCSDELLTLEMLHPRRDDTYYREIIQCVNLHLRAIRSAELIESLFAAIFFFDVGIGSLLQSASCVMIVIRLDHASEVMKFGAAVMGQSLRLFFNSWTGQKLVDHSTQVCRSVYNGIWYTATPRERQLLLLVSLRSQVPCSVTVAKLYVINMRNFGMVLKTSMSYCTLMASFHEMADDE